MALQEKHRSRFYTYLVDHVGEETAEAVLGQFPARDLDEPVTKEFVAFTAAELHTEVAGLRTELADLRTEMYQEFGKVRTELHQQTERVITRLQIEGAIAVIVLAIVNALVG